MSNVTIKALTDRISIVQDDASVKRLQVGETAKVPEAALAAYHPDSFEVVEGAKASGKRTGVHQTKTPDGKPNTPPPPPAPDAAAGAAA